MHNPLGPWQESHELYLNPMKFKHKLQEPLLLTEPVIVFDVGLGAGTNAIAALSAWKPGDRDLRVVSFEKDLELLQFALDHTQEFPFLRGWEEAISGILQLGSWQDPQGQLKWELRPGDFNDSIEQERERAEFIFFEPYSPKVNPDMWSLSCLASLYEKTRQEAPGCILATYSRATAVRSALLLAGFYVGPGEALGLKEETTLASTHRNILPQTLGQRWLERLHKSHVPFPEDTPPEDWPGLIQCLEGHRQFRE